MTCTSYCEKIEEMFDAIIRLADEVLPENRKEVNDYISCVWSYVTVWVRSIKREKGTEELRTKFESHVTAEEARLHRNLEDIMYDIDGYDTVKLVAGNGRPETVIPQTPSPRFTVLTPEQFLFPMLYLALKRDLERISLARKHVLSHVELWDAVETILYLVDAGWYRLEDLRGKTEIRPRYRPHSPKFYSYLRTTESRCQGTVKGLREGLGVYSYCPTLVQHLPNSDSTKSPMKVARCSMEINSESCPIPSQPGMKLFPTRTPRR